MGEVSILWIALGLFVAAMFAGVALARFHWRAKMPPWTLTALHGLFAAGGVVTLIIAAAPLTSLGRLQLILGLFLLTALGGVGVLSFHIRKRNPPKTLILAHASGAVTAFIVLLLYTLGFISP